MTPFHIIIPARFASSRLPGKVLMTIKEKPILQLVYERACMTSAASITIATDDEKVLDVARQFADNVVMTSTNHLTGTDRLAEIIKRGSYPADACIVNVQGDEPLIEPILIEQVANNLNQSQCDIATLCWPIESSDQLTNPNVVKVVRNQKQQAIYFSRQMIPSQSSATLNVDGYFRHIGLYAYRAEFLRTWANYAPCWLEQQEKLEQIRALWYGHTIYVDTAKVLPRQDINCAEDLAIVRALMEPKETI
jgi:3-deoxy-manno-octulosonate cytidylyltransferase (CMP-KDO synthetase)